MNVIKMMMLTAFVSFAAHAEGDDARLASEMKGVKVTLAQGLKAASTTGKPISGKFEVENGKLQLSVYTAKAGVFSEVIVDHKTGKVTKPGVLRRDRFVASTVRCAVAWIGSGTRRAVAGAPSS